METSLQDYFIPSSGGLALVLLLWGYIKWSSRPHRRLPPGPKPLPIIGNVFDVPSEKQWLVYDKWFKKYGDIVYLNVMGQPIYILGSVKRTFDLLEKRSSIYSDRVRLIMLNELMGWDFNFAMMRYGTWWRRHRRSFHEHFHPNAVRVYQPVQIKESRAFLRRLLFTPENHLHHIRHTFAAVIMNVAYGIQIRESKDPYITIAQEGMDSLAQAGVPGTFWVDYMPFLKYVPSWVPGAGFQRKAEHWRQVLRDMSEKPFKEVQGALRNGNAKPSLAATLIEALPQGDERAEEEIIAKNVAGMAYAGGADTTVSTVQSFFLAMAMYPEVQKKAQEELDTVVGSNRLPDFSDHDDLPYINATVKEIMRWQLVVPLAVPHATVADDEYDGYFIPKGSIIIGNSWSIMHDPEMYPEPEEFIPDRFLKDGKLNPEIRDPHVAAFGFGRRICPGRYMSDYSLFCVIASTLAVYNISAPLDENGNSIPLKPEMTSGMISYPLPYKCIIKPRSKAAEALILESQELET